VEPGDGNPAKLTERPGNIVAGMVSAIKSGDCSNPGTAWLATLLDRNPESLGQDDGKIITC